MGESQSMLMSVPVREEDARAAISTGVYGYPMGLAATVALAATDQALSGQGAVEEARFWLFGDDAYEIFAAALAAGG